MIRIDKAKNKSAPIFIFGPHVKPLVVFFPTWLNRIIRKGLPSKTPISFWGKCDFAADFRRYKKNSQANARIFDGGN